MKNSKRASQIVIRKGHPAFAGCAYVCQISRRIKNSTNYLIKHEKKANGRPVSHSDADKIIKTINVELYTKMPAAISQRMTQVVGAEWSAFYKALAAYKRKPQLFEACPRPPGYARRATTTHIGRNGFKVDKGQITFAGHCVCPVQTNLTCSQPYNAKASENIVDEIRIVPKGSCFVIEIVYDLERLEATKNTETASNNAVMLDPNRKIGIDLGINNLLTIVSNQLELKPVLIRGKHLKSLNAWYNKRAAQLRSNEQYRHLQAAGFKRHRRIKDALHRVSHFVQQYCLTHDIGAVVIGHNPGWKQEVNIGKVNNQKFVSIPHSVLIEQLEYKLEQYGIEVIVHEEAYTSKASALDNDVMPDAPVTTGPRPVFSGRRVRRGLYKAASGLINADVNGALNILRKATGEAFGLACRGVVFTPTSLTLGASPKRRDVRRNPSRQLAKAA